MPRNLDRRVEIAFPVLDPHLQTQVREILEIQLADTVKARHILPDGSSVRIRGRAESRLRSQERLYEATATKYESSSDRARHTGGVEDRLVDAARSDAITHRVELRDLTL